MSFIAQVLWIDFMSGRVYEETLNFPKFSKLMKLDNQNDIQILTYKKV
jgi:hypothetical protein